MVDIETFREMALSYPDTTEQPHFEKIAFRSKKIFATLDVENKRACLMLSPSDQANFCAAEDAVIYPVPNKWGSQGATFVELDLVKLPFLKDVLDVAFERSVAAKAKK